MNIKAFFILSTATLLAACLPADPALSGRVSLGSYPDARYGYYPHGVYYDQPYYGSYYGPYYEHGPYRGGYHEGYPRRSYGDDARRPYPVRAYPRPGTAVAAQQHSGVRRLPHPQPAHPGSGVQRTAPQGRYVVPNWSEKQRRFRR